MGRKSTVFTDIVAAPGVLGETSMLSPLAIDAGVAGAKQS
jgi:hypothetical protein